MVSLEVKKANLMEISIEKLLGYALDSGASDLHLSSGSIPMVRIHGEMKKLQLPEMDDNVMHSILNEILNENQKEIFKERLEIDFSTALKDKGRFRGKLFSTVERFSCCFSYNSRNYFIGRRAGCSPLTKSTC